MGGTSRRGRVEGVEKRVEPAVRQRSCARVGRALDVGAEKRAAHPLAPQERASERNTGNPVERVLAAWVDEGVDQHQLVHEGRVPRRDGQRDAAAHPVATKEDSPHAESGDEVDDRIRERVVPVGVAQRIRLFARAKAGEIGRYDAKRGREMRDRAVEGLVAR